VLSDRDKREHYDRFGTSPGPGSLSSADVTNATDFFNAIFGDLFGVAQRKSTTGRDLRYTLELDFEEAALGCEKVIVFERPEDCEPCRGSGAEGGPAGSTVGSTQRVPREGAPGRRGGPSGDLHVIARVRPHAVFGREGDVLTIDVPVSPVDATLGTEVDVPLLDGHVSMRIPAGTQAGSVFRLRGRGLPRETGGPRGDAHVRVVVETPAAVTDEARALLARVGELLDDAAFPRRRAFRAVVRKASGGGESGAT